MSDTELEGNVEQVKEKMIAFVDACSLEEMRAGLEILPGAFCGC